jgi:hypothetical protein
VTEGSPMETKKDSCNDEVYDDRGRGGGDEAWGGGSPIP